MVNWLFSFFKDVFEVEYKRIIDLLRQKKIISVILLFLIIFVLLLVYVPYFREIIINALFYLGLFLQGLGFQYVFNLIISIILLFLLFSLMKQNYIFKGSFKDDFGKGLKEIKLGILWGLVNRRGK